MGNPNLNILLNSKALPHKPGICKATKVALPLSRSDESLRVCPLTWAANRSADCDTLFIEFGATENPIPLKSALQTSNTEEGPHTVEPLKSFVYNSKFCPNCRIGAVLGACSVCIVEADALNSIRAGEMTFSDISKGSR